MSKFKQIAPRVLALAIFFVIAIVPVLIGMLCRFFKGSFFIGYDGTDFIIQTVAKWYYRTNKPREAK